MNRFMLVPLLFASLGLSQDLNGPTVSGPVILFVGAPSSGKSTQAAAAAKVMKLPVVAVEDLIKSNAETFAKIRSTGISGMEPQTDPVLNRLFTERLKKGDLSRGMILDGYPNTKDHADYVAKMAKDGILPRPLVIQLDVPDDIAMKRAEKNPKGPLTSVEQRLKDYHREMDMVRLYFPEAEIVTIDGTKSVKGVEKEVSSLLKKRYKP